MFLACTSVKLRSGEITMGRCAMISRDLWRMRAHAVRDDMGSSRARRVNDMEISYALNRPWET